MDLLSKPRGVVRSESEETDDLARQELQWQQKNLARQKSIEESLDEIQQKIADAQLARSDADSHSNTKDLREQSAHFQGELTNLRESSSNQHTAVFGRRIGIVERFSFFNYRNLACRGTLPALFCLVAYLAAGCCIAKILQEQSINVARAAGWL